MESKSFDEIVFMSLVETCDDIAKQLDEETYEHSKRVARLAGNRSSIYGYDKKYAYCVGLLHDVIEDTDCTIEQIHSYLMLKYGTYFMSALVIDSICDAVNILTRDDSWTYDFYIVRICESNDMLARLVKICDIKDHLTQKDTLKESLRKRYVKALTVLV